MKHYNKNVKRQIYCSAGRYVNRLSLECDTFVDTVLMEMYLQ